VLKRPVKDPTDFAHKSTPDIGRKRMTSNVGVDNWVVYLLGAVIRARGGHMTGPLLYSLEYQTSYIAAACIGKAWGCAIGTRVWRVKEGARAPRCREAGGVEGYHDCWFGS